MITSEGSSCLESPPADVLSDFSGGGGQDERDASLMLGTMTEGSSLVSCTFVSGESFLPMVAWNAVESLSKDTSIALLQ